jgi:hypothetical protein
MACRAELSVRLASRGSEFSVAPKNSIDMVWGENPSIVPRQVV